MKYKLRFFVNNGTKHTDCNCCFATLFSEHVPKKGQLLFLSDDCTDRGLVEPGQIYQTIHSVYCYDNAAAQDEGCNSVEVMVKAVDV